MRAGRAIPLGPVHAPPRGGAGPGRIGAVGVDRRGIHAASVLREPQDDGLPAGLGLPDQPQASSAADADPGTGGYGAGTEYQLAASPAQGLSLSAAGPGNRPPRSGLKRRYHVSAASARIRLSGGCDRLVLAQGAGLALSNTLNSGFCVDCLEQPLWGFGELQQRPGLPVHVGHIYRSTSRSTTRSEATNCWATAPPRSIGPPSGAAPESWINSTSQTRLPRPSPGSNRGRAVPRQVNRYPLKFDSDLS